MNTLGQPDYIVPMPFGAIPVYLCDLMPYTYTDADGKSWDVHVSMVKKPVLKTFSDLSQGLMVSKEALERMKSRRIAVRRQADGQNG